MSTTERTSSKCTMTIHGMPSTYTLLHQYLAERPVAQGHAMYLKPFGRLYVSCHLLKAKPIP